LSEFAINKQMFLAEHDTPWCSGPPHLLGRGVGRSAGMPKTVPRAV